jgi:aspartyl-tRNA(Asn)/glutamyl-tRNA(Gln) amidotransferase subunit C
MELSLQEVEHIASLARLRLSPEEQSLFRQQLSAILEYAARLQSVDTKEIQPTFSVILEQTTLREDQSRPGLARETLLENAPQTEQGQFRTPPVFE